MIDFEKQFERPDYATWPRETSKTRVAATFKIVYGWMCAGLALSGVVAWYTASSGLYKTILAGPGFMACLLGEILTVVVLSLAIGKMPVALAYLMFVGYAALNGLTLSVVFIAYELALVQRVFFITAGMFGGLALWGTFTKGDLSSVGSVCGMALWGLIIGSVVNLFTQSSGFDWLLTFAGIVIFTGLTMYDAQKIRQMAANEDALDSASVHKVGIMGALALYLDFINLFLYILRFFGRKR
ncbi:MAG: Bax inhibitor-1/YccA family protein [Kiritimatiellae bacterium]|nr:Bax inhibitor-1/YccA family protein [Kiritimatiellia bacterium]